MSPERPGVAQVADPRASDFCEALVAAVLDQFVYDGVVTSVTVTNPGEYTATGAPSNAASVTGGAGTGCTLNITYRKSLVLTVFNNTATATGKATASVEGIAVIVNG
jgi:hypothetical protein